MIDPEALLPALAEFLPHQRWYAGDQVPARLTVLHAEVKAADGRDQPNLGKHGVWPALARLIVDADGATYQVLVGLRPIEERPELLGGRDEILLGEVQTAVGPAQAYEATVDPELGRALLHETTGGRESAERVRPVGVEQSNTSLIFDDRLMMKFFRRLHPGPNPEVELTEALESVGFAHVAAPVAVASTDEIGLPRFDLAIVQPYLAGGVEGWAMALTSLRDLFGVHDTQPVPLITADAPRPPADPSEAGGDFSAEAQRLGSTTAEMHLALAQALGSGRGHADDWADDVAAEVDQADLPPAGRQGAAAIIADLRSVRDPGVAIRIHGDYHLAQVMRTDDGWYVLDFEGEPARPLADRRRPSSALRDVAGMLRSLHYASLVALGDGDEMGLAMAWEERNREAFLDGYLPQAEKGGFLPGDERSIAVVLKAFELQKSAYELAYERAHRPEWARIPAAAIRRLTSSATR